MPKSNETRMIVIAPTSQVTPDQITRLIHGLGLEITVKETCYGAMVEGSHEIVLKAVEEARKLDPDRIFTKVRGFPMGDARRCRAHHGSRPGFTQLEKEWECLSLVEKGVAAARRGEELCELPPKPMLSVKELKKVVEESK
ncbi:MAG TPA: methanogenesis marker 6 protein [Methanomassiliicoccales archaeon]|nr:methanogenesis marker 6 protein [Methanomassiliicoccales archaeon]